ncbi:MAG: HAD family phosphatase [Rhodoferax sp.]|nr:HAD family phosphatase [Rhodoferax sp.]
MIKAVIFDMDGVLIEAKDWHYEALNKALRLFGYEISRYDHLTTYDGLPTKKKLEMLSVQYGLPVSLHGFIEEMKQAYTMDLVYTLCKPRFIHEYALAHLKANGYKLAVASNSIRSTVEVMMNRARLDKYLDFYLSNQDVEVGKPNPQIYVKAVNRFNLPPAECLVIEDHENGIKAATAAGTHVMVVGDVNEVTLENIMKRIHQIQEQP